MTSIMIVSSCSRKKAITTPSLSVEDFSDSKRLEQREIELGSDTLPAELMYTGAHHRFVLRGVSLLRDAFGPEMVNFRILSAGYGLIRSDRPICSYDVTFSNMSLGEARAWAQQRGIPDDVRKAVASADLVIFLLGARYLDVINLPIVAIGGQRIIFLASPRIWGRLEGSGIVTVPAGREQVKYGAPLISLKGKMFELWATAVVKDADLLERTMIDDTSNTFLSALS